MANTTNSTSPLGFGLSCTYCTMVLPEYDPVLGRVERAVTTIQMPLGVGTNPRTGKVMPSCVGGRANLLEALVRRYATTRGALPDYAIPTTTGAYGIDILDMVYSDMSRADAAQLAARIDAQAQLDERVVTSVTKAALIDSTLVIADEITDSAGPFKLTMAIDTLAGDISILSAPTT